MKYFQNPRRTSRRSGKKRRTAAQRRATAKMLAANRRRRRGGTSRKRRRRLTTTRRPTMARKRGPRLTAAQRRSKTRRTRRRPRRGGTIRFRRVRGAVYSRNPNLVNMLTRGVMDGVTVVAGKAVAGFIGSKIPQFVPGALGGAVNKVVVAIGVGFLASRFLSADRARLAVAGAFAAPIETMIKAANIPLLSEGLSDDDDYYEVDMQGYPALQGYPAVASVAGVGDTEDEYEYSY